MDQHRNERHARQRFAGRNQIGGDSAGDALWFTRATLHRMDEDAHQYQRDDEERPVHDTLI
jgi:hypothetical protein